MDVFLKECKDGISGSKVLYTVQSDGGLERMKLNFDGVDMYMLFNESVDTVLQSEITFAADHGDALIYDAVSGKVSRLTDRTITLEPYETRFVIFGADIEAELPEASAEEVMDITLSWAFEVEGRQYSELFNIAQKHPRFAGTVSYHTQFEGDQARVLDLGYAGETVEVTLNGEKLGMKFAPPYRYDLAGHLKAHNELTVRVTTHLGYERRDRFSSYLMMEPLGLLGPVVLKK